MTIDGFIAGPNGEMDWMTLPWTDDINQYVQAIIDPVDSIVLGRKLAEGFIPYWADVAANPNHPEVAAGQLFTTIPKIVFTQTLDQSPWDNTVLARGDLVETISNLKQQTGKEIYACGGATFVSSLIKHDLIDEYHLFVNPAAIGQGMTIFEGVGGKRPFKRVESRAFDCGIVVLRYRPERDS
jgi:dihydrofolate reductase